VAAQAYSLKQWAADTSHLAPMTVAPQKCSPFSRRLTCQGSSPGAASTPPTILPAVLQAGRSPQSARHKVTVQDSGDTGPCPPQPLIYSPQVQGCPPFSHWGQMPKVTRTRT
jgi:hypothetical protein